MSLLSRDSHRSPSFSFFKIAALAGVLGWGGASAFAADQAANPAGLLKLHKWSGAINVPDPVACAVDPQGRVYVTSTARRRVADLEIREHPMWVANDLALTSVEEKESFLKDALAPGKLRAPRGALKDQNQDGSIDWHDLTVPSERIYQLRDTDGDGTADKITVFAEGFNTVVTGIAAGVLYHDGWVYATIAPDLWRFKDTDDDGVADIREIVVHGFGLHIAYGGHDMHGLMVGVDGRIYWSIGDKAVNVTSREGRHFFYPYEGAVMRIEPDGSGFEVYAHGLRNPQEPAFDDYGDLFVVDNDADMEGERERFVYIPEASDSGWRFNYQFMGLRSPWMQDGLWKPQFEGQPVNFLPPISNYSDGPAGFKRDPGTALNDAMRGVFLLNEFPSGKMRGFRVERDGASFKMIEPAIYNEGIMGVGMSWHSDGSLMMVDWLAGWIVKGAGAIWQVDGREGTKNPLRLETHRLLAAGFSGLSNEELVAKLGHRDQRVRQGVQFELVKRGESVALLRVAQTSTETLFARLHAIWGYGQLLRHGAVEVAPMIALLRDTDPEIRTQTARVLGDAAGTRPEAKALIPLLADESPRVRLQAAIALGKLREPAAVAALLAMAEKDFEVPVLRHAVITGLAGCATAEQLAENKTTGSRAVRLASVVALRRQGSPAIAEYLTDGDELVVGEAVRGIYDESSISAAMPRLAALLDGTERSEAVTRRLINANLRLGTPECAARLLDFALNPSADRAMRIEALTCLRIWKSPEPIDRVDGHTRRFESAIIAGVLAPKLGSLLGLTDPELKSLGIEIMIAHSLRAGAAQIAAIIEDAAASGELRAQALRLMAGNEKSDPAFDRALEASLTTEAPAPLHRAALELLLPAEPERLVTHAKVVLQTRSIPEKQHALDLIARSACAAGDAVLADYAAKLLSGTCPPALQLDVIEALRVRSAANASFAASLKAYEATPGAATHNELLAGGDSTAGGAVMQNNLAANCLSCHSITSSGGSEVGPNLRLAGRDHDVAYLLESVVNPSAQIAIGYGVVSVTLKDGSNVTGTLAFEKENELTIRLFDGVRRTVPKANIADRTAPISIMPPMLDVLQPREIRDVVAYLASMTGKAAPKVVDGEESH